MKDVFVDGSYLYVFSFAGVFRIFFGHEHSPDVFFELMDGLDAR